MRITAALARRWNLAPIWRALLVGSCEADVSKRAACRDGRCCVPCRAGLCFVQAQAGYRNGCDARRGVL